ncbi:MAG: hypothetical protein ACE5HS_03425 [bacterium]
MSNVTAWKVLRAQDAQYADFPANLQPSLIEVIVQHGIKQLYTHQADATKWQNVGYGPS